MVSVPPPPPSTVGGNKAVNWGFLKSESLYLPGWYPRAEFLGLGNLSREPASQAQRLEFGSSAPI